MTLSERVAARHLARQEKPRIPVVNKDKDRIVYVLPETADEESGTYERIPQDSEGHIKNKGKPRRPTRPKKPRQPHRPEIPRATTPAPTRPPKRPLPVLPVPPVPPVKRIKPVKDSGPVDDPRKWKIKKPKPLQARVLERHLEKIRKG